MVTASCRPPLPVAENANLAVPSASTVAGQVRTSVPSAAMVAVRTSPSTFTPSAASRTSTSDASSVAFVTRTRISAESPTRRKRGSAGRSSSGWVETSSPVPSPTLVSPLTARTWIRQVVRSSGIVTWTDAVPSSFVTSCALQWATFLNSLRGRSPLNPAPPLPWPAISRVRSFARSMETDIDDPVVTARPRSNQNALMPSGPRSSSRESSALSTTATDSSERTPVPVWSLTAMS